MRDALAIVPMRPATGWRLIAATIFGQGAVGAAQALGPIQVLVALALNYPRELDEETADT